MYPPKYFFHCFSLFKTVYFCNDLIKKQLIFSDNVYPECDFKNSERSLEVGD